MRLSRTSPQSQKKWVDPMSEATADYSMLAHLAYGARQALADVSFSIPSGGISAVIGPNGAGKTTLFNCISGVARHVGKVELEGRDLSRVRADRRAALGIARTFQTPL